MGTKIRPQRHGYVISEPAPLLKRTDMISLILSIFCAVYIIHKQMELDEDQIEIQSNKFRSKLSELINGSTFVLKEAYDSQRSLQTKISQIDSLLSSVVLLQTTQDYSKEFRRIEKMRNRIQVLQRRIENVSTRLSNISASANILA